jgi:hypothetical protein
VRVANVPREVFEAEGEEGSMIANEEERREAAALAVSDELQRRMFAVLNDPEVAQVWARAPHCSAHGIGNVLTHVLVVMAKTEPHDLQFGVRLIDQMRAALLHAVGAETATQPAGRPS